MTDQMLSRFKEYINTTQFNAIRLGLASAEKMKSLSYGEVKKIETINYRTLKPEKDGLFCARIFGPVKDWECNCGKYKRMKHRGVTCEKCGVEVIQSRVRRERMGHIELVAPICHIWFVKGIPSVLGVVLDMSVKDLERIIYFDSYMVINQGKSPYPIKTLLSNADYRSYLDTHSEDTDFVAKSGAEAIKDILRLIDLDLEIKIAQEDYERSSSLTMRHKLTRKLKILTGFKRANLALDLIVMSVLPVLPPDLRPLVPLEGGRFASSDLNELYRRVLNRNIRLRRLMDIDAPEVIIKNEKRMLQESVDALIDNGRRGQLVKGSNKRPLKSLSEMLRGKQGRFRQNLLGKRVDYSGRSVIVFDPELKLDQCGIPKRMALEIFKPFVLSELIKCEFAPNLRMAKKLVEDEDPVVWDVLEQVVKHRPVLLNRAPTLHRLGIQSFYPILVDGKAVKIHPLVCNAFNADFDGDTMSVHVPLSQKAVKETKELTLSTKNILSASHGKPLTVPTQDMVLGLHYITKARKNSKGENTIFSNVDEVISAYQTEAVDLHALVKLRLKSGEIVDTTVGRSILFGYVPEGTDFSWINKVVRKKEVGLLIEKIYSQFGQEVTVECLDKLKNLGFLHSTKSGSSFSIEELIVPKNKGEILKKSEQEVDKVEKLYMDGAITNGERESKVISIWGQATAQVAKEMMKELEAQNEKAFLNEDKSFEPFNSVYLMLESGAKGSIDQIKQLIGMRGLMSKPSGETMETPVKSNFKEGLSVFEYFISTHGARKGQADTALKTANSGYLTRRLVDVAQDVVITKDDCGALGYVELVELREAGDVIYPLAERAFGRIVASDAKDPVTGEMIVKQGEIIDKIVVDRLSKSSITKLFVKSLLTCQSKRGACAKCYGMDLSTRSLVDIGATVGIVAAQSIGEPGTQLTMRTFHIGGIANVGEMPYAKAKHDGTIQFNGISIVKNRDDKSFIVSRKASIAIISKDGRVLQDQPLDYGTEIFVTNGQTVKVGEKLAEWDSNNKVLLSEKVGTVKFIDLKKNLTYQDSFNEVADITNKIVISHKGDKYQPALVIEDNIGEELAKYFLPTGSYIMVENGQKINLGDILIKIPVEAYKTKDITGGLPRIAELFEARAPKDPAIISDIDGIVEIGGLHRGMQKVIVSFGDQSFEYLVPRGKQLNVSGGDKIKAGDLITSGEPVLQDILRILGPDKMQTYLVSQIQKFYFFLELALMTDI